MAFMGGLINPLIKRKILTLQHKGRRVMWEGGGLGSAVSSAWRGHQFHFNRALLCDSVSFPQKSPLAAPITPDQKNFPLSGGQSVSPLCCHTSTVLHSGNLVRTDLEHKCTWTQACACTHSHTNSHTALAFNKTCWFLSYVSYIILSKPLDTHVSGGWADKYKYTTRTETLDP